MASHRLRLKKGATSDKLLNQAANWLFEIHVTNVNIHLLRSLNLRLYFKKTLSISEET